MKLSHGSVHRCERPRRSIRSCPSSRWLRSLRRGHRFRFRKSPRRSTPEKTLGAGRGRGKDHRLCTLDAGEHQRRSHRGVGIVVLLWTVIKVLGNIEKSFNDLGSEDIQNPRAQICRLCLDDDLPGVVDHRQQRDRIGRHAGDRVSRAAFVAGSGGRGSDRAPQIFALWVLWLVFTLIYVFMPTPRFS